MEKMMKKLRYAAALVAGMFVLASQAEGTAKTLADVGTTGIAGEPNVALIDRGAINPDYAGTYALVFSNAQTTTFTFNSPWAVKEFLVVGGGGAGGGNGGAGGGGGGVIYFTEALLAANAETDNATTNFENGSTISLTVGAGGKGGFKLKGPAGGHSTLTLGAKTYTAFGGGGGGDWQSGSNYGPNPGSGNNTGCGAGRYSDFATKTGNTSTMPNLPGYYGTSGGAGKAKNNSDTHGGGGGAGEAGGQAVSNKKGGKGGDGLPCSITGTEVYYAAGGGGGDQNQTNNEADHAEGGKGGGGHASIQIGRLSPEANTVAPEISHATGYGCGGGGGMGGGGGTNAGGNGSAGIVVLLIEPVVIEAEKPVVSVLVPEQGANYAKFSVAVVADGLDNKTESEVWGGWAKEGEEITCTKLADAVAVNGSVATTVTGLEVGATYVYKFYAVNEDSVEGDAVTGTIALEKGDINPESADPVITSGACAVIGAGVNIPYCVAWPGKGKESCSVTLKYGLLADKLSYSVDLGSEVIGNGQAQATGLIPGRKYYFQLTADNGEQQASTAVLTATISDGEAFPTTFDARQPVIAGVGAYDDKFICGGDGVIYRGLFANYVEGTEVIFHYKKGGTWKESAAVVTPDGFTVTVENDLTISTDYPFYFTATAGDFVDQTQEKSFNSRGPADLQTYILAISVQDDNTVAKTGTRIYRVASNNSDVGCGTNTVLSILARKSGDTDWFVLATTNLTSVLGETPYYLTEQDAEKLEWGSSYQLTMRIENTTFGGTKFVDDWLEKNGKYKDTGVVSDGSTYIWCGADGLWNDSANWTTNVNKIGLAGYPVYGSTAKFTNETAVVTARVVRAERVKNFVVENKKTLCLLSESEESSVAVVETFKVTNANLAFAGTNPVVKAERGITFNDLTKSGSIPSAFTFNIPADGYAEAPLQLKSRKFAYEINDSYKISLTVDSESGFLGRATGGSQLLISSAAGIAKDKIVLGKLDKECYKFRYAPADSANPTELWLDVKIAQIGDVKYDSLAKAIAAVQEGETIKLLDDLALTEQVKVEGKSFTLDLGGKTVTFDGCDGFYFVGGEVTVQNGTVTMEVPATANGFAAIGFEDADGLVKDVVVNAGNAKDGVVCCSAGNEFNGKTVVCENVEVTGAGRNFYAETAAMTLDADCSAAQSGHFAGGDAYSDALAAGWLGRLTVNGGTYSAEVNVVGTMSSPATITLNAGTFDGKVSVVPIAPGYVAMGEHNITKAEAVELAAPDGYGWIDNALTRVFTITYVDESGHGVAPAAKTVAATVVNGNWQYALVSADLPKLTPVDAIVWDAWYNGTTKAAAKQVIVGDITLTANWKAAVVKYTNASGVVTYQAALPSNLVKGTYELLSDISVVQVTFGSTLIRAGEITLDLGGYTLTTTSVNKKNVCTRSDANGIVATIRNGKIITTANSDGTAVWMGGQNNTFTLASNLEVVCAKGSSVLIEGTGNTLNTAATITTTGTTFALGTNGSTTKTATINVTGGSITSENVAIYAPGDQTLNISGGTIIGTTAVEIRAGTLNVTGGTLVATATEYSVNPNGSGSTTKGAAVAVSQHTTERGIAVSIAGATLTGVKAVSVANPQENDTVNVSVTLGEATYNGALAFSADGNATVTKNGAELDAPEDYKWDDDNKLVAKVYVAQVGDKKYETVAEAMEAALADAKKQGKDVPDPITIIADGEEEISGEEKESYDDSKEVVFVKGENEQVVPVVQTSTAVMQGVTAGGKALTANTPKLREFLTANGVAAYTAAKTSAEAISTALAAVPTVEGNNGLELWKDYALGIEPTTPVKAVPPATDTATDGITLEIPALKTSEGSGDFTISYQVINDATERVESEAESADAIKIPLATGVYDVKIVFEIQKP